MPRPARSRHRAPAGPSQRQLRAGEIIRHALVEILREEELRDPALAGVSVTVTEVRMSPDLKHALCFVSPLGGAHAPEVTAALNRVARFLRGRLGHVIDMRTTPDLRFVRDQSFEAAEAMNRLLANPRVRRDVEAQDPPPGGEGGAPDLVREAGWGARSAATNPQADPHPRPLPSADGRGGKS